MNPVDYSVLRTLQFTINKSEKMNIVLTACMEQIGQQLTNRVKKSSVND